MNADQNDESCGFELCHMAYVAGRIQIHRIVPFAEIGQIIYGLNWCYFTVGQQPATIKPDYGLQLQKYATDVQRRK